MKVMAIIGSMRKGNTYQMVQSIMDVVNDAGLEFEVVHLKNVQFGFCDGCLSCDETGICHLNDGMTSLVEKVGEADALILASPTRWSLLSGEMKVFLDRLNPLAGGNALANKKAVVFAVGQTKEDEDNSILTAAESMISFCDNAGIEVIGKVLAYDCLSENTVDVETIQLCRAVIENLVSILKRQK